MSTQRSAFVAAAWAAIDDPADTRVALHGAPLGARRPGADVVGAIDHHKPHGDYARKALAVKIGQPQEFFVLAERLERWRQFRLHHCTFHICRAMRPCDCTRLHGLCQA
jgi:hypothetical protein